jgi:hypothetical protein
LAVRRLSDQGLLIRTRDLRRASFKIYEATRHLASLFWRRFRLDFEGVSKKIVLLVGFWILCCSHRGWEDKLEARWRLLPGFQKKKITINLNTSSFLACPNNVEIVWQSIGSKSGKGERNAVTKDLEKMWCEEAPKLQCCFVYHCIPLLTNSCFCIALEW